MGTPSPDIGAARLAFAMENAARSGDMSAWLIAAGALYDRAKNSVKSEAELRASRGLILEKMESLRGEFRSRVGRLWAAQQVQLRQGDLFRDEAACRAPDLPALYRLIEAGKSRTLLDHLGSQYSELPDTAEGQEIRELEKHILSFPEAPAADWVAREILLPGGLPILEQWGARNVQPSIRLLEAAYSRANAGFHAVEPVAELEQVQRALQPEEVLMDYYIPPHPTHPAIAVHVLVVGRDSVQHYAVDLRTALADLGGFAGRLTVNGRAPLETSPLAALLFACRTEIEAGDDAAAEVRLRRLAGFLIEPALKGGLDAKRQKRWIVSPHHMLHAVPWNAVVGKIGSLDEVAITLAPSASVWQKLRAVSRDAPASFLAFGNPRPLPDPTLKSLPQAEAEVSLLSSIVTERLDCTVLINQDASEAALRRDVGKAGVVHFATHGAFPEQDAMDFHQLLLAAGDGCDGRVLAEELRRMCFQSASLVVLSVCNGGLYRFGPGDEPYGLLPAIVAAGALNVVGPLWSIADNKARQFMTTFYSHLFESGPAEALRQTCRELVQQGWQIRDWAGFLLTGTGRALHSADV